MSLTDLDEEIAALRVDLVEAEDRDGITSARAKGLRHAIHSLIVERDLLPPAPEPRRAIQG